MRPLRHFEKPHHFSFPLVAPPRPRPPSPPKPKSLRLGLDNKQVQDLFRLLTTTTTTSTTASNTTNEDNLGDFLQKQPISRERERLTIISIYQLGKHKALTRLTNLYEVLKNEATTKRPIWFMFLQAFAHCRADSKVLEVYQAGRMVMKAPFPFYAYQAVILAQPDLSSSIAALGEFLFKDEGFQKAPALQRLRNWSMSALVKKYSPNSLHQKKGFFEQTGENMKIVAQVLANGKLNKLPGRVHQLGLEAANEREHLNWCLKNLPLETTPQLKITILQAVSRILLNKAPFGCRLEELQKWKRAYPRHFYRENETMRAWLKLYAQMAHPVAALSLFEGLTQPTKTDVRILLNVLSSSPRPSALLDRPEAFWQRRLAYVAGKLPHANWKGVISVLARAREELLVKEMIATKEIPIAKGAGLMRRIGMATAAIKEAAEFRFSTLQLLLASTNESEREKVIRSAFRIISSKDEIREYLTKYLQLMNQYNVAIDEAMIEQILALVAPSDHHEQQLREALLDISSRDVLTRIKPLF